MTRTCLFASLPLAILAAMTNAVPAQDTLSPTEAEILPRVIDSICADLVEDDNGCQQVMLLASASTPDRADLIILGDWRTDPPSEPMLVARSAVFNGHMWGMAPSLAVTEAGSLQLTSEQTGIGRFPWYQTLTIAYRDGRFVLAGFTYSTYDRAAGGGMTCDVNLLTGEYAVEATRVLAETEQEVLVLSDVGEIEPLDVDAAGIGTNAPFPAPCEAGIAALDAF
jgi:hypothetical protein